MLPAHALGGIAGSNSARITGCVNEGTVEAKVNEEDSEGTSLSAGGITGDFSVVVMGADGILSDCINNGTVISDNANTGGTQVLCICQIRDIPLRLKIAKM